MFIKHPEEMNHNSHSSQDQSDQAKVDQLDFCKRTVHI